MKKIIKLIFILLITIIIILGGLFYVNIYKGSSDDSEVVFTVEEGKSAYAVLDDLKANDLIGNKTISKIYLKLNDHSFISGNFLLNKNMSAKEIFEYISDPKNVIRDEVKITFKEGDWAKHYAAQLSEELNIDANEILSLWNDETFVRSLMDKYPFIQEDLFNSDVRILLEGYLFPNTYIFDRDSSLEEITYRFLDETLKVYNKYLDAINDSSLTVHEIFTLASIVQYEASSFDDMKNVASVFYNRMNIGMKLQSSVTVCYALDLKDDDSWTMCETNPTYDSPYNTYMYEGLPPGPILNMSEKAIEAVLYPNDTDYFYFVADVYGDSKVYYSKTYEEHLEYIRKFGL